MAHPFLSPFLPVKRKVGDDVMNLAFSCTFASLTTLFVTGEVAGDALLVSAELRDGGGPRLLPFTVPMHYCLCVLHITEKGRDISTCNFLGRRRRGFKQRVVSITAGFTPWNTAIARICFFYGAKF
jgi:hypothetical protein